MRRASQRNCLVMAHVLAASLAGVAAAQDETTTTTPAPASATVQTFNAPEGKTLPARVVRARWVHRFYQANSGYDAAGNKLDLGISYQAAVNAVVGEVGVTDKLSLQVMAPFFYRNRATLDPAKFRASAIYKSKRQEMVDKVVKELVKTRLTCYTETQCREWVERGSSLPMARNMVLPTGETLTLTAGQSIAAKIDEELIGAANPELEGAVGLGDVETGMLYNFYRDDKFMLSAGLGVRWPTANSNLAEGKRPLSSGVTDAGLRLNFDYSPISGMWISVQEQIERSLTTATWQRPSMLKSSRFNLADPNDGGDGMSNKRRFEKRGHSFDTLVKASYGFGALHQAMRPIAMNVNYQTKQERSAFLDGEEYQVGARRDLVGLGASVSGLAYRLPVELEVNYAVPTGGKNSRLAPTVTETMLKLYARF